MMADLLPWLNVLILPLGMAWVRHALVTERRLSKIEAILSLKLLNGGNSHDTA